VDWRRWRVDSREVRAFAPERYYGTKLKWWNDVTQTSLPWNGTVFICEVLYQLGSANAFGDGSIVSIVFNKSFTEFLF